MAQATEVPARTADGVAPERRGSTRFIWLAIGAFVVTCAVLFAIGSMLTPSVQPGYPVIPAARPATDGTFLLTADVADRTRWVPIDLRAGRIADSEADADILARRYVLRAPGGALDLGKVALADAAVPTDPVWVPDEAVDGAPQSNVLTHWYTYSYWSHLLTSREHTFAVRTRSGGVALLNLVSYYCDPDGSGCLTIRYRLVGSEP